jgi:hypothetical protein
MMRVVPGAVVCALSMPGAGLVVVHLPPMVPVGGRQSLQDNSHSRRTLRAQTLRFCSTTSSYVIWSLSLPCNSSSDVIFLDVDALDDQLLNQALSFLLVCNQL